ncbi:MAG TPA: Mpo1-like protein [Xanthobacteraceae bacterium]|nr:Mpo1-like protein [Xanthobacteraceae bacterium]
MNAYFRRQLTLYSTFHGNAGNCLLHGVGIPPIFFAVMVVLALRLVPIAGAGISIGTLLLIPAMLLWLVLDAGVGGALLAVFVPLAAAAEWVARTGSITLTLSLAATAFAAGWLCLLVGHSVFEGRRPGFVDDVSLLFIGPMFVVAKGLVALGFRPDLAPSLEGGHP